MCSAVGVCTSVYLWVWWSRGARDYASKAKQMGTNERTNAIARALCIYISVYSVHRFIKKGSASSKSVSLVWLAAEAKPAMIAQRMVKETKTATIRQTVYCCIGPLPIRSWLRSQTERTSAATTISCHPDAQMQVATTDSH